MQDLNQKYYYKAPNNQGQNYLKSLNSSVVIRTHNNQKELSMFDAAQLLVDATDQLKIDNDKTRSQESSSSNQFEQLLPEPFPQDYYYNKNPNANFYNINIPQPVELINTFANQNNTVIPDVDKITLPPLKSINQNNKNIVSFTVPSPRKKNINRRQYKDRKIIYHHHHNNTQDQVQQEVLKSINIQQYQVNQKQEELKHQEEALNRRKESIDAQYNNLGEYNKSITRRNEEYFGFIPYAAKKTHCDFMTSFFNKFEASGHECTYLTKQNFEVVRNNANYLQLLQFIIGHQSRVKDAFNIPDDTNKIIRLNCDTYKVKVRDSCKILAHIFIKHYPLILIECLPSVVLGKMVQTLQDIYKNAQSKLNGPRTEQTKTYKTTIKLIEALK